MLDLLTQGTIFLRQHAELYGGEVFIERHGDAKSAVKAENESQQGLAGLQGQLNGCHECVLSQTRARVVFGRGNPKAQVMCVGGVPSREDDAVGSPFTGRDGELLVKILAAIEFSLNDVYLATAVKCMADNQADALTTGLEKCSPFLQKQISMVKPQFILALGETAARGVLGVDASVASLREKVHKLGDVDVVVTHHPAELHDNVELKRATWSDVQMLRKLYNDKLLEKTKAGPA